MKKHSQLRWLASLALGAGVLAAYGIHDAQAAYAALPADGTAWKRLRKHSGRWNTPSSDSWHTAFLDNFPAVWAGIESFLDAKESALLPSKKVAYNDKILESGNLGDIH